MKANNSLQQQERTLTEHEQRAKSLKKSIDQMMPAIKRALPAVITPERFSRIIVTAVSNNPKLADCTVPSFLGAMMNSAQLGLEANTPQGQAYLIPYYNSKKHAYECQFQLGYQGMIDLARRAGTTVDAHEVKENDEFSYEYGLHPDIKHKPAMKDRGATIAYYGIWRNGNQSGFEVMTKDEVEEFAKAKSQSYGKDSSPWKTNFDAMAKKTVLKKALKYAPKSSEIANAISADDTIKNVPNSITQDFDITLIPQEDVEDDTEQQEQTGGKTMDAETGEVIDAEAIKQEEKTEQGTPKAEPDAAEPETVQSKAAKKRRTLLDD